jgi:MFS transporter, PAT family, beta-lactamase induction signal transducer AmpG
VIRTYYITHKEMKNRSPWAWIPTLYFAEGLPYVIVTALSIVMYMQMGLTDAEVGLYTGWLALPWVIKPFWSPFIDLLKTKRWWVLAMQVLMGSSLAGIAFTLPTSLWFQGTMFFLFVMAFASATHDISADGFYMIELDEHNQAKYVGLRNTFYRLAVIFVNGALVSLAGVLEHTFNVSVVYTWTLIFYGLAALLIGIWLYHCKMMPHAEGDVESEKSVGEVAVELKHMLLSFFQKFSCKETVIVMVFLLFYRFPEALLNTMTKTFLMRPNADGGLGLSPEEYGLAQGTVGLIGLLLGGIIGGILVSRDGMKRWLWPMVCAITLPDAVYIFLAYTLNANLWVVSSCLFVEQFGYGLGFTVLTLYMLFYSQGKFRTSHYSICTGISFLGLMVPGMVSGYIKDLVGYQMFFIIVMVSCLITFLVTAFLKIDPDFGKKK